MSRTTGSSSSAIRAAHKAPSVGYSQTTVSSESASDRSKGGVSHAPARRSPRDCTCRAYSCRSEEHTSELQSLMRISYAVFCLKKKKIQQIGRQNVQHSIPKAV